MTRTTSSSILAAILVAVTLSASPAFSQAAGGGGQGGGGGGGGGAASVGGGGGGGGGEGGWSPVLTHAVPGAARCTSANCYDRRPRRVEMEKREPDNSCSTWRRIMFGVHPRCDNPDR